MPAIKAISYHLPENSVTNEDLVKAFPEWNVEKIANKIGIDCRYIASPEQTAGDLAFIVASKLLEENEIDKKAIDFLLLCTQSPDYFLPTTACILQDKLGLPKSCGALDYNLGCSGAIYGLALASSLVEAGMAKNVLLITAETYNKHIHPSDKSNRSLFGDGAAACIVSSEGKFNIGKFVFGTDGSGFDNLIIKTGGMRCKNSNGKEETDGDGHVRRDDYLYMNGTAVFNFTLEVVPGLIKNVIKKNGLESIDNVDYFILHQANKYMLDTIRKITRIPKDKFFIGLADKGNTVSSTCLMALKDAENKELIKPGDQIVMAGFGVGLSYAGCLIHFN